MTTTTTAVAVAIAVASNQQDSKSSSSSSSIVAVVLPPSIGVRKTAAVDSELTGRIAAKMIARL